jgi:hypothetical protein
VVLLVKGAGYGRRKAVKSTRRRVAPESSQVHATTGTQFRA